MVAAVPPKAKKSRRKFFFTVEQLQMYSHIRQEDAAPAMGVSSITLKRICKENHYRWPYRTIKARLRREARQKAQAAKALSPPSRPTHLPTDSTLELLLQLRKERKTDGSPTSVSGLATPLSPMNLDDQTSRRSPQPRFPLSNDPVPSTTNLLPDFVSFIQLAAQEEPLTPTVSRLMRLATLGEQRPQSNPPPARRLRCGPNCCHRH